MVMRNGKPAIAQDFGAKPSPAAVHKPRFIAIDPGDVHVGVAEFERQTGGEWLCRWAHEFTPETFEQWYVEGLQKSRWVRVVIEWWKLFPESAPMYIGSDMPTSRLIGAIQALARAVPSDAGWFDDEVPTYLQSPQIKVPCRALLKRRKLRSVAKILGIPGDHASDAELHGYKWLFDHHETIANAKAQDAFYANTRDLSGRHSIW
jgi:hypothetical protein